MRPRASDVTPPVTADAREAEPRGENELTRAQAHALRRCAPLTPAQFKAKRLFADQGMEPFRAPNARSVLRSQPRPRQG